MNGGAVISKCGKYRYTLERKWCEGPTVLWVMLNPSTADAEKDDPTIRRCIAFSQREDFGSLIVENLYAYRSTDPSTIARMGAAEARGPENFMRMVDSAARAEYVICAWGTPGGKYIPQALESFKLRCLGRTKHGAPKHPLYLAKTTPLEAFP